MLYLQTSGDAAVNLEILRKSHCPVEFFPDVPEESWWERHSSQGWVVDALLGTGALGAPRPPLDTVIRRLNRLGRPILAVDLPSGLDCDTGEPADPTIMASETCTFVAAKPGLVAPHAYLYVGRLTVLPIGVPFELLMELGAARH